MQSSVYLARGQCPRRSRSDRDLSGSLQRFRIRREVVRCIRAAVSGHRCSLARCPPREAATAGIGALPAHHAVQRHHVLLNSAGYGKESPQIPNSPRRTPSQGVTEPVGVGDCVSGRPPSEGAGPLRHAVRWGSVGRSRGCGMPAPRCGRRSRRSCSERLSGRPAERGVDRGRCRRLPRDRGCPG